MPRTITLSDATAAALEDRIALGGYADADEAIAHALAALDAHDFEDAPTPENQGDLEAWLKAVG